MEGEDLIVMCRMMKEMKTVDRDDMVIWDTGETKVHSKKLRKQGVVGHQEIKVSIYCSCINSWIGLKKNIVQVKLIHEFKTKEIWRQVSPSAAHLYVTTR